jgi:hypothetical protein
MEGLARLVTESLARHGFETTLDPRRLQWSKWFRCEDSFGLLLVPGKAGLLALAEEMITPGEVAALCGASEPRSRHPERSEGSGFTTGKRMLALYQISQADDLGMSLGRLFLPGSPERERFASGRCFARYAVIEDAVQRQSAHTALLQWLASVAETASGVGAGESLLEQGEAAEQEHAPQGRQISSQSGPTTQSSNRESEIASPAPLPGGF